MQTILKLPRADYPEDVGVSSEKLNVLMNRLKSTDYHGFMLIRGETVAAEWYRSPVTADSVHAMYSVSKSITSLAIGYAIDEGLLSTDDHLLKFFPEYEKKIIDVNMKKITIHNLLSMTAGRKISILSDRVHKDWIDIFMKSKFLFEPGKSFEYVNENFFILSEIIKRTTGLGVTEYLYPRLFEPLGIEKPFWETDHKGVEAGGWGLFMSLESLAKIFYCFSHNGKFNGKQIIPLNWINRAIKNYKGINSPVRTDQGAAYGYGVWRRTNELGSYRFDGVFTQFAEYFEEYDAVAVMIGGDPTFDAHRCVYDIIDDLFLPDLDNKSYEKLCDNKKSINFNPLEAKERSVVEKEINGKTYRIKRKRLLNILGFPMSILTYPATYMMKNRAGNIDNIRFDFNENNCDFQWNEGNEKNNVLCGMNGEFCISEMMLADKKYTAYSSAQWICNNTLKIEIHPLESVGIRTIEFTFKKDKIEFIADSTPSLEKVLGSLKRVFRRIFKSDKLAEVFMKFIIKILEPKHKGK